MQTTDEIQQDINQQQALYREWLALQPRLEAAQRDWQRAAEIISQLQAFYYGERYRAYGEAMEQGAEIDLTTPGEYSVMSEDALWNAFAAWHGLAWQQLRGAVATLDPEAEDKSP